MVAAILSLALREYFGSDAPLVCAEDDARFRAQMLRHGRAEVDSDAACTEDVASTHLSVDIVLATFAHAPHVDQLAVVLASWFETRANPVLQLPRAVDGVVESASNRELLLHVALDDIDALVTRLEAAEDTAARVAHCAAFITRIGGARGILTLLGFRETVGSRNVCPLTRAQCIAAFTQQHGRSALTVGARAFTKHCVRSAESWWGAFRGNDAAKNCVALAKLEQILDDAVWKNVHSLPHAHVTMEVRNALGYGARWTIEDRAFRGFLEPQMPDGHASRWRH